MRQLLRLLDCRLQCMDPLPAITLNLEVFKQVMAFSLLSLPAFTLAGLWASGGAGDQGMGAGEEQP